MAHARVANDRGRLVWILNVYEKISFNIGPTLMHWFERKWPSMIESLVEADKASAARLEGHGNAIAQVYNHVIMPLASERDQRTQIRWGIEDFKHYYGRRPAGMWLAETGANKNTLRLLAEEGIRFTIMAPGQAHRVRKLGEHQWYDVLGEKIDPYRAYRHYFDDKRELYLDCFFYDGPVSQAVSFSDPLASSHNLMSRLEGLIDPHRQNQLVHIATDGEVYGHHKAWGERSLAYALHMYDPQNGGNGSSAFQVVNYAYFLDKHPPEYEVEVNDSDDGLGTSWSCAHGTKRWRTDCGCNTGGLPGWNQKWREPLREAVRFVSEKTQALFLSRGKEIFTDPEVARTRYIEVATRYDRDAREAFLREVCQGAELDDNSKVTALCLLEMEHQAMLSQTSCGWFFSELSGIEPVQDMKFAARALQLFQFLTGDPIEPEFLSILANAKSNLPEHENGAAVYERYVRPEVVTLEQVAAHAMMTSIFDDLDEPFAYQGKIYSYEVDFEDYQMSRYGDFTLGMGKVRVRSLVTLADVTLMVVLLRSTAYDIRVSVAPMPIEQTYQQIKKGLFKLATHHLMDIVRYIDEKVSRDYFGLRHLFKEEKRRALYLILKSTIERFSHAYTALYDENRRALDLFQNAGLATPKEFQVAE